MRVNVSVVMSVAISNHDTIHVDTRVTICVAFCGVCVGNRGSGGIGGVTIGVAVCVAIGVGIAVHVVCFIIFCEYYSRFCVNSILCCSRHSIPVDYGIAIIIRWSTA